MLSNNRYQLMADPIVSIVMVAHNADAFIAQALESIQRQSFVDFELIVINDGSTDRTGAILSRQIDSRFVIQTNVSSVGLAESFGLADSMARGKYIARMNPDALSHPHRIQIQADYLDRHADIELVGCHSFKIDNKGKVIYRNPLSDTIDEVKERLRSDRLFFDGCVMFRRAGIHSAAYIGGVDLNVKRQGSYPIDSRPFKSACLGETLYYRRCTEIEINTCHGIEKGQKILGGPCTISMHPHATDGTRYDQLRAKLLACPEDRAALHAYYREALNCDKLAHARSTLDHLLHQQPKNHTVRRLLIGMLLQLKELKRAMDTIEQLVAFSTPDNTLIDMALDVRKQLGAPVMSDSPLEHPSISLCMIVKNEAALLGPCLNSIKGIVDEIIVVDTGSTDSSADIARIYGAKVYAHQWRNDFSDARNTALEKANGDWILILDADEIIASRDQASIVQQVQNDGEKTSAYTFKTRNYTNLMTAMAWQANDGGYAKYEAGTGWFPTTKVRLFPNDVAIRFRYPVHELVDPAVQEAGYTVHHFPAPIHHYGTVNEDKNILKARHYFKLGYVKLEQFGKDHAAIRELAVQAGQLEKWPEAIELWERLLSLVPDYGEALANMAGAHWQMGRYEEGLAYARRAVQADPGLKEAQYNLAINLMMLGQLAEASSLLKHILGEHPDYLAAEFMLAVVHSLNDSIQQGQALYKAIEKKISLQALTIAIKDLLLRLPGSVLAARAYKIVRVSGLEADEEKDNQQ